MNSIISTNPSDGYSVLGSVEATTEAEIITLVQRSREQQKHWSDTLLVERVGYLREVYDACTLHKEDIALSVAEEMGMPIRLARDEVQYGLGYFLWYLDNAEISLAPEVVFENETEVHTVYYEPKGVIAAITPWNYPFMLFAWACIQPLLAGNTVIWKISKEVILTGKLIASIIEGTQLPKYVWSEIYGDGKLGDFLTDQDIDGITFTGSTTVGNALSKKALEKGITAVMELGGSAPGIVMEDANIDSVLETIYFMRFSNSGQMCDGLKRLIVHESRYNELVNKLNEKILSKKIGNAQDETVDVGPLVSESQLHAVELQLQDALDHGANVLLEYTPESIYDGAYMPLYLLGNITRDMRVWKEEVFGPILPIVTYTTQEEAIMLANDTPYGLGAYVFTESHNTFNYLARHIKSGMVQMNNVNYCIPSDPFGGYKASGIGREHGKWGFHELCNIKVTSTPK
ncbi:aldehyde dehydrogenase [Candidatus Gracilibacteria bacterium]|nr:aldehyde dehydrogenase [Candidatus Gracilibacteria bacterium]